MASSARYSVWPASTIKLAVAAIEFQHCTNAPGDITLLCPAKPCRKCHIPDTILVLPAGLCLYCWFERSAAAWARSNGFVALLFQVRGSTSTCRFSKPPPAIPPTS